MVYSIFFFLAKGLWGQLTHWLANLFPQNEMSDENVNLSEQTRVSIDHKERYWCILPAHANAKKGLLLTSNLVHRFTMTGLNLAGIVSFSSSFWLMLSSYSIPHKCYVPFKKLK